MCQRFGWGKTGAYGIGGACLLQNVTDAAQVGTGGVTKQEAVEATEAVPFWGTVEAGKQPA